MLLKYAYKKILKFVKICEQNGGLGGYFSYLKYAHLN